MSFLTFYLLSVFFTGLVMIGITWYEYRHKPEPITLGNILTGAILALVPLFNVVVLIFFSYYFIDQIAPKIVVFGGDE